MEYRELGKTGVKISAVGFGCWAMGAREWGSVSDEESINAVKKAFDVGINFFDTAPFYGFGHSEQILAKALGERRKDIFLATKVGLEWDNSGKLWTNSSPQYVRKDCERSLKNLNTDCTDLLQIHWPDEKTPIADTMGEMLKLQKEGKTRFIGVSNFSIEQIKECSKYGDIVSLQPPYSMIKREVGHHILPFCREQKIGVLAYSPLQQGLLTGKFGEDTKFPENDLRAHNPLFNGIAFKVIVRMVDKIKPLAEKYNKTMAQFAINWTLCNPAVTSAIVGAKRPSQVEDNAAGADWKISEEDLGAIEIIFSKMMEEARDLKRNREEK